MKNEIYLSYKDYYHPAEKNPLLRYSRKTDSNQVKIEPSQGDGWKITTPHGYIDYVHNPEDSENQIWWVETKEQNKGHGKELVDLMQNYHPASTISWGVTTIEGKRLRDSWHAKNPNINQQNGAFDGQFDPSGNNYGENEDDEGYNNGELDD